MAFAGPDLEEEFNAFKGQEIDAELGIDEKKASIINTGASLHTLQHEVSLSVCTVYCVLTVSCCSLLFSESWLGRLGRTWQQRQSESEDIGQATGAFVEGAE